MCAVAVRERNVVLGIDMCGTKTGSSVAETRFIEYGKYRNVPDGQLHDLPPGIEKNQKMKRRYKVRSSL